jgi:hypothetical protein
MMNTPTGGYGFLYFDKQLVKISANSFTLLWIMFFCKMKYSLLVIAIAAVAVYSGCKSKTLSKEDILSSHKWSYYEISFNDKKTDATTMGNPVVTFNKDNTYKLEYGPMADSGTWKIVGDTIFSTISYVANNQSQSLSVLTLTADTFKVQSIIDSNVLSLTMVPYKEEAN